MPVRAVLVRGLLAWLALAGLGRLSALDLPGSLWIACALAWAVIHLAGGAAAAPRAGAGHVER